MNKENIDLQKLRPEHIEALRSFTLQRSRNSLLHCRKMF